MAEDNLNRQNIVALLWDFDKTLIPGYMQTPIFKHYGMVEKDFWNEVNQLPAKYAERGIRVSADLIYLNHLLSAVRTGAMPGLNNALLRKLGAELQFYPGLPEFFGELKTLVRSRPEFVRHDIRLEHYVISTGLAEMIRGSAIAPHVEAVYGCEFIENPLPVGFLKQAEFGIESPPEISQLGVVVDNTAKTRYVFEVNKGTHQNPAIDVNANIAPADRRIPIPNMIYIADGPSDVPVFSVVKKNGGRTFAVHDPANPQEFMQNDMLLQVGRIHAYGPADYTPRSSSYQWLRLHTLQICERLVREGEQALANRVAKPPRHLHKDEPLAEPAGPKQDLLFDA